MSDQLEMIFTAMIVLMMVVAVYRTGRANPENTGVLGAKIGKLDARLLTVELAIEDLPTVKDVEGLRGDVKALKAEITHICKTVEATDAAIVRVEQHLLGQSTGRRR